MRELDKSDIASYIAKKDSIEPALIKNNNRQVLRTDELSEEDINAIRTSTPPATHDQYNDEMDET